MIRMAVLLLTCLSLSTEHTLAETRAEVESAARRVHHVLDAERQQRADALWGKPIDSPVAVHDPATGRTIRWNPALGKEEEVPLPSGHAVANTCVENGGQRVAVLVLPLPDEANSLSTLVWHERWHCLQKALGLDGREGDNAHLDGESGRTWLRLELRALAQALSAPDAATSKRHALAALSFRVQRSMERKLGTGALLAEAQLERNEGLAEYSGRRITFGDGNGLRDSIVGSLAQADGKESYVRSFAYFTGPAYGVLLDRWQPRWRSRIDARSDLPTLLADGLGDFHPVEGRRLDRLASRYGLPAVRHAERKRAVERERRADALRAQFVEGEVVRLPLQHPSASFDPRSVFPLGEEGTFYSPLTVIDEWGTLTASTGALLANDWSLVRVSATGAEGCGASWSAPGWKLELADGWSLAPGATGWEIARDRPAPCGAAD